LDLKLSDKLATTSVSYGQKLPNNIRVSIGSAIVLGLLDGKLDAAPLTAYLMTYSNGKCSENCGFCTQANKSEGKAELLSRVAWPIFPTTRVIERITTAVQSGKIMRVCIQTLNYPTVFDDLTSLVTELKRNIHVPISASCQPISSIDIQRLAKTGLDRIGIAIDVATEQLFDQVKGAVANGSYTWDNQFHQLTNALKIFGKGKVSTHLIIGLGESEKDAVNFIDRCVDLSVLPALFAFTPIKGTALKDIPPPKVDVYRRIQLAHYLIINRLTAFDSMTFDVDGRIIDFGLNKRALDEIIETGKPFQTSGCKNCNRPFYNEKPSGPIYNFPWKPSREDLISLKDQLRLNQK
jgi:biotin synthase-related radical SAM superfamily protein